MTTTISVDENTLERFREIKAELDDAEDGVPDHTADSFVSALLDTWEAAGDGYYTSNDALAEPDEIADAVAERVGPVISEVVWDTLDADELAQQTASYVDGADTVTLEASERRAIAEEVAEMLGR